MQRIGPPIKSASNASFFLALVALVFVVNPFGCEPTKCETTDRGGVDCDATCLEVITEALVACLEEASDELSIGSMMLVTATIVAPSGYPISGNSLLLNPFFNDVNLDCKFWPLTKLVCSEDDCSVLAVSVAT